MIHSANMYEAQLRQKFYEFRYNPNYKYYFPNGWAISFKCDGDNFYRHQFAIVDKNDLLLGYIEYSIDRICCSVYDLAIINFSDDIFTFGKDLKQVIVDIFMKFNFRKIKFTVFANNPARNGYEKILFSYGGRLIGLEKDCCKLLDNQFTDAYYYEIFRDSFIENYKVKRKEEKL